jgi:hypothetical protein
VRYILRKFVEAGTVEEALSKDSSTPVHDAYLKEGEEPKGNTLFTHAIGFSAPVDGPVPDEYWGEPLSSRKKR